MNVLRELFIVVLLMLMAVATVAADSTGLPDPQRTPGAVNAAITPDNIGENICKHGWSTKSIRPKVSYTNKLKRQQIGEYGYADKAMKDYEEDHLISLEIGGSPTDPRNLWPEPYAGKWGARTKDHIEDHLHAMVCRGQIGLREAQQCIASDWIDCYRKYLGDP